MERARKQMKTVQAIRFRAGRNADVSDSWLEYDWSELAESPAWWYGPTSDPDIMNSTAEEGVFLSSARASRLSRETATCFEAADRCAKNFLFSGDSRRAKNNEDAPLGASYVSW